MPDDEMDYYHGGCHFWSQSSHGSHTAFLFHVLIIGDRLLLGPSLAVTRCIGIKSRTHAAALPVLELAAPKKKKKRKKPFKGGLHTAKSPHSKGHPQKWGTSSLLPFHPASTGPSVSSRSPTNPSLCPTSHSTTGMNRDYQGHAPRTKRCARNMSTTFHASHPHLHPRLLPVSHWLIHPCRSLARRSAMIGWRGHISPSSNHFQSIRGLGYSTRCAEQTLRA